MQYPCLYSKSTHSASIASYNPTTDHHASDSPCSTTNSTSLPSARAAFVPRCPRTLHLSPHEQSHHSRLVWLDRIRRSPGHDTALLCRQSQSVFTHSSASLLRQLFWPDRPRFSSFLTDHLGRTSCASKSPTDRTRSRAVQGSILS